MRWFTILALAVAVGLAAALSPFASASPDGLERVATDTAFADRGVMREAPAPDYAFPGVDEARLATGLAGLAGTLGVFALGFGVIALVRR